MTREPWVAQAGLILLGNTFPVINGPFVREGPGQGFYPSPGSFTLPMVFVL